MSGAPSIRTNAFRFPPSSTTATHCGTLSSLAFATAASINSLANSAVIPCFSKVLLILKSLDGYGGKRPGFRAERWPPSLSRFNRIARAGATLRFGEACSDGGALCGAIRLQARGTERRFWNQPQPVCELGRVARTHRGFFGANSHSQQHRLANRKHDRGHPTSADHRHARNLDDHREIVWMAHEAIRPTFHRRHSGKHDYPRIPARAEA